MLTVERMITLAGGARLCVDEVGDPADPLVLQLEGHMAQLIATPRSYCERLADRGFRVVRVDNRDVGRSSRCPDVPYTLLDLADDVHALIGELGGPAVVCGRSMGGAVAQLLALEHPGDVAGLGLFFTWAKTSDGWGTGQPTALCPAPFHDEDSFVAWEQTALPGIAGPGHPFDPRFIDELARTMWARGVDWTGFERQRRAMGLTPPWAGRLGRLRVPVSILHGTDDPVIPVAAGRRLAKLIPLATLRVVDGLGHQQPPALDELFVAATLDAVPPPVTD